MEKGHSSSVNTMLETVLPRMKSGFTAIDVGCGNGWVVRRLNTEPSCAGASGVDGANTMIEKARTIDSEGTYTLATLPEWSPNEAVDLVHSMEFLYYLEHPMAFLKTLQTTWLREEGWLIIGLDHYVENEASHDWSSSLNVHMAMHTIEEWIDGFREAGFRHVEAFQTGEKEGWAGTLVLMGQK